MIGAKVIRETDTDIHACAHTQMHMKKHKQHIVSSSFFKIRKTV
jgi:hypothetical protein